MKKSARILAVLAAAATLGLGMVSCDYWKEDWYKANGSGSSASSGSGSGSGSTSNTASSGSAAYAGNLTVNSVAYTTLTMTGDASSGTAVLSGNGGSANGTYARSAVAAAANTLNLSGTYTLTFSFGTITVVFANNTVTISAGSVAASGTASASTGSGTTSGSGATTGSGTTTTTASTTPAITTLNGLTFVNSANSSEKIVGTSDSALEWHNPSFIAQISNAGGPLPTTYDSSTGVMTCSYSLKQVTDKLFDYIEFTNPWFDVNYGMCGVGFAITNATTLNANDGADRGTFVRQ